MPKTVQLQSFHDKNGHLTEFAGFNLPLWYQGIIPESLAVRNAVGIFDVSHMGRAIVTGSDAENYLQYLTSNDVTSLQNGSGQYSLLCNSEGGIQDDVLLFRIGKDEYLIVYNAANRESDLDWLNRNVQQFRVGLQDVSDQVALFAVQGPRAASLVGKAIGGSIETLPRFACTWTEISGSRVLISRSGYTGEDGFEVFVWDSSLENPRHAENVWGKLCETGRPLGLELCGLGARDVLRLEAGLCLYGTDIDVKTNPLEARLGFAVKFQKDFIGRDQLLQVKARGPQRLRVGMVTKNRVIPRHGYEISSDSGDIGMVTSGTLSPVLNTGIAMGYVDPNYAKLGTVVNIHIRERHEPAETKKMPFYDTAKYGYSRKVQNY